MVRPPDVRQVVRQERIPQIIEGIITGIMGDAVRIRLLGSRTFQEAGIGRGIDAQLGDRVVAVRADNGKWIVISAYDTTRAGGTQSDIDDGVLSPPSNFSVTGYAGVILAQWDIPPQAQDITIEVQINDSETDVGATTVTTRSHAVAYFCGAGTTRYFRVRMVRGDYEKSAWTSWASATSALLGVADGGTGSDLSTSYGGVLIQSTAGANVTTENPLSTAHGGTGHAAGFSKGNILVAEDTTTLSLLAAGTDGYALLADSSEPSGLRWGAVGTGSEVESILTDDNGCVVSDDDGNVLTE